MKQQLIAPFKYNISKKLLHEMIYKIEMGRRRSLAEDLAECSAGLGSATCDYSAELRQTFDIICGFAFAAFCARRWR